MPARVLGGCVALALALGAPDAASCPSCPVGETARQRVLDDDFATNLVVALAPFAIVGLVARRLERRR